MLATRIRQKDGVFYFASYPAKDVLDKVRFISRFYGEGEQIAPEAPPEGDEVASFIARIERVNPKVNAIVTFLPEEALKKAKALDRKGSAAGPLARITSAPAVVRRRRPWP